MRCDLIDKFKITKGRSSTKSENLFILMPNVCTKRHSLRPQSYHTRLRRRSRLFSIHAELNVCATAAEVPLEINSCNSCTTEGWLNTLPNGLDGDSGKYL